MQQKYCDIRNSRVINLIVSGEQAQTDVTTQSTADEGNSTVTMAPATKTAKNATDNRTTSLDEGTAESVTGGATNDTTTAGDQG